MIRTLNFAFIALTGLLCLGLYRIAEEARIAGADLKATRAAILRETETLAVLGAEWARVTQPGRIQALANRHLDLSDQPRVQLSSLAELPPKNLPIRPEDAIRTAKMEIPQAAPQTKPVLRRRVPPPEPLPEPILAAIHTGT